MKQTQDTENFENLVDEEQVQSEQEKDEEEENGAGSEEEEEDKNDTYEEAEAKTSSEEEAKEENYAGSEEVNEYEERLLAACKDVTSKIRSIRSASAHHNVPYSTLYARVKNGNLKQKSAGRPKFLTEDEGELFASSFNVNEFQSSALRIKLFYTLCLQMQRIFYNLLMFLFLVHLKRRGSKQHENTPKKPKNKYL